MKILAGLGNPDTVYTHNRHNVGFQFLDYFILNADTYYPNRIIRQKTFEQNKRFSAQIIRLYDDLILVKPQTYMNRSGISIRTIQNYYKMSTSDIIIAHDDLDIPFGKFKIQQAKGPKVHNGILSIEKELGSANFWRIRIGVENRTPEHKISGNDYVLSNFTHEEKNCLNSIFEKIGNQLKNLALI